MRRRDLLAGIGTATLPTLAGCGCMGVETWPGLGFTVEPTALTATGDGWTVDATVEILINFGGDGTGIEGVSLAAFDQSGSVAGTTQLGDLLWGDIPESNRTEGECGSSGTLRREATVEADAFPQWVGIRYDEATRSYTEPREISVYGGEQRTDATVDAYQPVAVEELTPSSSSQPTEPPVASVRVRPGELSCEGRTTPDVDYSVSGSTDVDITADRALPETHFRPTLTGFEYGDVLRFDIGLRPRPQLRRTDCTTAPYEVRLTYDDDDREPQTVELRHLGRDGSVVETIRRPLRESGQQSPTGKTPTR